MLRAGSAAILLVSAAALLAFYGSGRDTNADQIGEITWSVTVEPEAPSAGDEVRLYIRPCCFSGSPFMGQQLHVTQAEPPVFEVLGPDQFYSYWRVRALRDGEASFQLSGAYEKWSCYQFPTPTPASGSTPEPTRCASNFLYYSSPEFTVTVGEAAVPGDATPTATPEPQAWFGDANCDGQVDSRDAAVTLQVVAGLLTPPGCFNRSDVNRDCRMDSRDALLILQTTAGLISPRPYESVLCITDPRP